MAEWVTEPLTAESRTGRSDTSPERPCFGVNEFSTPPAPPRSSINDRCNVLRLQRAVGNRAVSRLLTEVSGRAPSRSAKPGTSGGFVPPNRAEANASNDVQRDVDPTTTSITPAQADALSDDALARDLARVRPVAAGGDPGARENLATLLDTQSQRYLRVLAGQGEDFASDATELRQYCSVVDEMSSVGRTPTQDPQLVLIPADRLLSIDEDGQIQLSAPTDVGLLDADLVSILDRVAVATSGSGDPGVGGDQAQVLLWDDGRALMTPPMSGDFASLIVAGTPQGHEGAELVARIDQPWQRARDSAASGVLRSGIYQLGTFPITQFNGVHLPAGSRCRFADPTFGGQWRFRPGAPPDSRLFTIFNRNNGKFYSWDAHVPVTATPHDFYHVNQRGMYGLLGHSDHAPIPASQLSAARGIRWVRIGGRIFLVVGVAIDAALLTSAAMESSNRGTPRPLVAQALRTIGSWGGAWAGMKLLCVGGAAATSETGPGAVLGCVAGGIIGGFAGYWGADWLADMIDPD